MSTKSFYRRTFAFVLLLLTGISYLVDGMKLYQV